MMNKSLAAISRTSPGIMSPADSFTMSPGTSCWSGISFGWPSRTTVAVTLIIALSLAAALSARVSCTKRSDTPRTTIDQHHRAAARNVAGGVGEDGQDRQQDHQRIADGDPKPVQPLVLPFLRDLVGAVLLQPRRRFFLAQAGRRRAQPLQDGGGFLHRGVVDEVGRLWIG